MAFYSRNLFSFLIFSLYAFLLLFLHGPSCCCHAQQLYEANKQLNCYGTNASSTLGYNCSSIDGASSSCTSYVMFRSQTDYQNPAMIGFLLNADPSKIASINNVTDTSPIPINTLVIVPLHCSCFSSSYYQYAANYTLKTKDETYFTVANDTYQGLSTCQALMSQNPYKSTDLKVGQQLYVPVRCACPTQNQTAAGVKYLLSYLVTWGDDVSTIANRFNVDQQSVLDANTLLASTTIFPFTTLLVPLPTEPTLAMTANPSPPPPPPPTAAGGGSNGNQKWVFVGVGIGAALLILLCVSLLFCFLCWRRRAKPIREEKKGGKFAASSDEYSALSGKPTSTAAATSGGSSFSGELRTVLDSLTVYKFEELEKATESFSEKRRIRGSSVYGGVINGDAAAVKRVKGNVVSNEINILRQVNHLNVVRLSGFCLHGGDTYFVYEFAENGSLADRIHHNHHLPKNGSCLDWKQRTRVACDVADGLNYLHNYTNPPYVHKDLKSSNILIDAGFRAKVGNFGLARTVEVAGDGHQQLTRHVVGTQGYMAPEYLEHGLITPKLDVFAFGVVLLEILSGKEVAVVYPKQGGEEEKKGEVVLLSAAIREVLGGENVREKLKDFVDPCLGDDYPFELAFAVAQLAMRCVENDPNSRPSMSELFMSLSAIHSSSLDWDPPEIPRSNSMIHTR